VTWHSWCRQFHFQHLCHTLSSSSWSIHHAFVLLHVGVTVFSTNTTYAKWTWQCSLFWGSDWSYCVNLSCWRSHCMGCATFIIARVSVLYLKWWWFGNDQRILGKFLRRVLLALDLKNSPRLCAQKSPVNRKEVTSISHFRAKIFKRTTCRKLCQSTTIHPHNAAYQQEGRLQYTRELLRSIGTFQRELAWLAASSRGRHRGFCGDHESVAIQSRRWHLDDTERRCDRTQQALTAVRRHHQKLLLASWLRFSTARYTAMRRQRTVAQVFPVPAAELMTTVELVELAKRSRGT